MKRFFCSLLLAATIYSCSNPSSSSHNPQQTDSLHSHVPNYSPNWQNLDLEKDGVFGISTEKAYSQLLANKKAKKVIVAIIDSGIDPKPEDLQSVLWTDSSSGAYGRNYLGPESGKEDFTLILAEEKRFYDSLARGPIPESYRIRYAAYRKAFEDYSKHLNNLQAFISKLKASKITLEDMVRAIGKVKPTLEDFKHYNPGNDQERKVLALVLEILPSYPDFAVFKYKELDHLIELTQYHLSHGLNWQTPTTDDVKSTVPKINQNDLSPDPIGLVEDPNVGPYHGFMMAGIIAANRHNGKGIDGIADHTQIMMIKAFNNFREMRENDLAAGIRYSVDHGARILSLSLGRPYCRNKEIIDSAVQYAMSKDALIIHASGNDGLNLDLDTNFWYPSPLYKNAGKADAWITVGASGSVNDSTLVASFSNYGQHTVDVFAPGINITSTLPNSRYTAWSGTSNATPVVAGLAALIMEYYPALTAIQVKEIIMKTVVKSPFLKDKCVSGGVVNAYNALKLAADY